MVVDIKKVQGRRELRVASLDDVVADAEKLVASPHTRTLGNWPLPQLLTHLAMAIDKSIDGISFAAPWHMRLIGFLIRGRVLRRGLPAGFKLPKELEADAYPAAPSAEDALESLRRAVARSKRERMTARHPVFGKLSHEQWTQLHLRHAELHLSFAVPNEAPVMSRSTAKN
jgi:hypothetical protein